MNIDLEKPMTHLTENKEDRYRPKYHMTPPVGLLNDPNGFIYFKGKYHVFYQWNPFKTDHSTKYWGHFTSGNLYEWHHETSVLAPEDWFDHSGCYSGSAIENKGNLIAFYTGNVKNEKGERETYQCMATSKDGMSLDKKGPILHLPDNYTAHFRDPKVWKKGSTWYMIVGTQTKEEEGMVAFFSSENLTDWEHHGPIAGSYMNGLDYFGYMWECPDLFSLSGQDILIVSPQGLEAKGDKYNNLFQSGYFIGEMNYEDQTFSHGTFTELDRGFDFYAPQTTIGSNGKRLLVAWMGMPDEDEKNHPTIDNCWIHGMTIPRELSIMEDKLYQKPVEEMTCLRTKEVRHNKVSISTDFHEFDGISGNSIEMVIDILSKDYEVFNMRVSDAIQVSYDSSTNIFSLTRRKYHSEIDEVRECILEDLSSLNIFIDVSTIEIFINGGQEVFSARYFTDNKDSSVLFSCEGELSLKITKWDMKNSIIF
ncbi:sucrose-6-phosphate hydrolase [Salipaludibacillus neizhouensis]|uniref:Sucrose-6-phosphate hydrolase n=1 Tax=Salipaludibacillus neizhouensis TaxID=885475 RepID=A0A3A9KCK8_9BACI|nr:sucrose-6-phosphate hydrolase [Salipaludibacillus neizhouensis]RKL67353.1 sucrose-6-phosphate hydrolase [Salipaludibacillus neizhouensis]